MINIIQLRTFIIVLTIILSVNGCAFLGIPWQLSAASAVGDIVSLENHGKTMTETAASIVLQKDCQWSRIFTDWKVCLTFDEYVDNLIKMNCKTYSWNFLNIPYCKEND